MLGLPSIPVLGIATCFVCMGLLVHVIWFRSKLRKILRVVVSILVCALFAGGVIAGLRQPAQRLPEGIKQEIRHAVREALKGRKTNKSDQIDRDDTAEAQGGKESDISGDVDEVKLHRFDPITKEGLLAALSFRILSGADVIEQVRERGVTFNMGSFDEQQIRMSNTYLGKEDIDGVIEAFVLVLEGNSYNTNHVGLSYHRRNLEVRCCVWRIPMTLHVISLLIYFAEPTFSKQATRLTRTLC